VPGPDTAPDAVIHAVRDVVHSFSNFTVNNNIPQVALSFIQFMSELKAQLENRKREF